MAAKHDSIIEGPQDIQCFMLLSSQLARSTRCRDIARSALCRASRTNKTSPSASWRCLASKTSVAKTSANATRQVPAKSGAPIPKITPAPASGSKATPPKPLAFNESAPSDLPAPKPFTFRGTDGTSPATPSGGKGYPAQLLVYHAGIGGITFVAVWKLTALLGFIFAAVYIAPYYYYSPMEEDTWMAALSMLLSFVLCPCFGLTCNSCLRRHYTTDHPSV